MAVKVRLRKTGGKNDPSFRVVATDGRSPRDGRFIELLGWYDPKKSGVNYQLKLDRIREWQGKGAVVSETVRNLLKKADKAVAAAAVAAAAAPASTPPAGEPPATDAPPRAEG